MNIEIRPVTTGADKKAVYPYQCGYSHIVESFEDFIKRADAAPDLYLAAFDGGVCVGICHGGPSRWASDAVNLDIIATERPGDNKYARKGIGSRMLQRLEQAAKQRGFRRVHLGSSMGGAELFYMSNGYRPVELVASGANHEMHERVPVTDYESGRVLQRELLRKHKAKEVNFIFEKTL